MWSLLLHPRSLNSKNAIAAASRSCIFAQFIIAFNLRNESRVTGMSALPAICCESILLSCCCTQCLLYTGVTMHIAQGLLYKSLLHKVPSAYILFYALYTVRDIHSGGLQTIYMQWRIQIQYTVHSGFCTHTVDIIICSFFCQWCQWCCWNFSKVSSSSFSFLWIQVLVNSIGGLHLVSWSRRRWHKRGIRCSFAPLLIYLVSI